MLVVDQTSDLVPYEEVIGSMPALQIAGVVCTVLHTLEAVEEIRPDLVLQCCGPHEFDGLEILQRLRDPGRHQCDAILVVAHPQVALVLRAARLGVISCLVSPVASDILRDHLGTWLNRRDLAVRKAPGDLLDQDEVNVLVHGSRWAGAPSAERGQPVTPTLELVAMALRNASSCLSAAEIGRLCGLSSVATRRYLNQLVDEGKAVMSLQYGRTGRPRHLYRWIS